MLIRYALLSLLQREELHGYRVKSAFSDSVGPYWSLNFGQIYQTLKQLRARGLVEARFDSGGGHMGRWVYRITPKGRRALETWLRRSPRPPDAPREEIFIRLLAVTDMTPDRIALQLANERRIHFEHLQELRARRRSLEPPHDGSLLHSLVLDAAILRAEAHLEWIQRCSTTLSVSAAGLEPSDASTNDDAPSIHDGPCPDRGTPLGTRMAATAESSEDPLQ